MISASPASAVEVDQLDLLSRRVGEVRDPLDRFFTPDALAHIIVAELRAMIPTPRHIVEPSVGGGAFARAARRAWPEARITGVDVDPAAEGKRDVDTFVLGDWPELAGRLEVVDLVLGNPPFTGVAAIPHVEAALSTLAPTVALILPWSCLGGVQAWSDLMDGRFRPEFARTIAPRPWPKNVRETALFVWTLSAPAHTKVRALPRWS